MGRLAAAVLILVASTSLAAAQAGFGIGVAIRVGQYVEINKAPGPTVGASCTGLEGSVYAVQTDGSKIIDICCNGTTHQYEDCTPGAAAGAPLGARYLVADADATLTTEVDLSALSNGILTNTVGGGISTIGVYAGSTCSANQFANAASAAGALTCAAIADADVPNNITISLAATATALAANGANCSAGAAPLGVDASGAAESCTTYVTPGADVAAAGTVVDDSHYHSRQHDGRTYWTWIDRTNYDSDNDGTADTITWPGTTGTAAPSRTTLLNVNTNTSAIAWSEKFQVWLVLTNGVEDLDADGTADDQLWMGDIDGNRIWAGPIAGGTRDWESIALTSPYSNYVYVLAEQASQDILEFDIRELFTIASGTAVTTVATWDIDAVDTTACINGSNGYEAMTFVPDRTQCSSYTTTDMPCGYFLLECQANAGTFYKFRLDTGGTAVQLLDNSAAAPCGANDTTSDGDGMDTDFDTGLIWQSIGGGQDLILVFDAAFNCVARFAAPNAASVDYEGIAIGPDGFVAFCDDAGGDCHRYRLPATRGKPGPTTPLIQDTHIGVAVYSDATAGTHDTGALVCGKLGRRCLTTEAILVPAFNSCTTDYNTGSAVAFMAMCR